MKKNFALDVAVGSNLETSNATFFSFFLKMCFLILWTAATSCTVDEEESLSPDLNPVSENLEGEKAVYKGIFATKNADFRGSLRVVFPNMVKEDPSADKQAVATLTLSSGETFEAEMSPDRAGDKTAEDFNVAFDSKDLSFNFFLDELGNPVVSDVVFKQQDGSVVIAEHTEESPVTPVTGIYKCTNCQDKTSTVNGIELNNEERVFNMLLTTKDGQTQMSIQAVLGSLISTEIVLEESCTTVGDYTYCTLKSGPKAGSDPVTWSGVHRYTSDSTSSEICSTLSGNLSWVSPEAGLIEAEFISDSTCPNNTYYVSSTGDDSNTGLSPQDAWKTVNRVNSLNIQPGDAILFEGGQSFDGNLYLDENDANNSASIVKIASYGTGKATLMAGTEYGIYAYNTSGIKISNLIIAGSGMQSNNNSGIYFYNNLPGNVKLDFVEVSNTEVYGFKNHGIVIHGDNANAGFSNVLIENNKVHDILDVGIASYGDFSQTKTGYAHSNFNVRSCEVFNIKGHSNSPNNHSGNGIMLSDVQNSKIERSTVYNSGSGNTNCGGPVGIWYWDADKVVIQYNEVYNMSSGSGCDGGGFDLDGGVTNGVMQYNYSHDNDGAGFMVGQFTGARPMNNITIRYNVSENDAATNGGSVYLFNGNEPMEDIYVYNNTFYLSEQSTNPGAAVIKYNVWYPVKNNVNFNNNILYAAGGADLVDIPSGYDASLAGNLYHSTGTFRIKFKGSVYNSLESFRTTGNEVYEEQMTGLQADPLLVNAGNGGTLGFGKSLTALEAYRLQSDSPAINKGIRLPYISGSMDFYGGSISTENPEIGAHASVEPTTSLATN